MFRLCKDAVHSDTHSVLNAGQGMSVNDIDAAHAMSLK